MKVFWILIALLALGTAALLVPPVIAQRRAEAQRALAEQARAEAESARLRSLPAPDQTAPVQAAGEQSASREPVKDTPSQPAPAATPEPVKAVEDADKPAPAAPGPAQSTPLKLDDVLPVATPVPSEPSAPAEAPATPAATVKPADAAPAPGVANAKVVRRDDGTLLVDERFVVKGEGTAEKPYEVTWEHLVSAAEVYDPQKGKKELPGRITMLDGKHVRIVGYVAFPLYVDEPKELLSMLNQWDGCCIGVPPTPYDAVEVKLVKVVDKEQRTTTFGSVEGKLSVKPYLVGQWLVGLYLMDDAKLTSQRYGGFGS
jgi:hypothetical protein